MGLCLPNPKPQRNPIVLRPSEGSMRTTKAALETKAAPGDEGGRGILNSTTVRLNVEENQLVNAFGEFGICLGGLKGA